MNPSLEIDVKPAAAASPRPRAANGRNHKEPPEDFMDVLADLSIPRSANGKTLDGRILCEMPAKPRGKADESSEKKDSIPDEIPLQLNISVDVNQFLHGLAAVVQRQTSVHELATPPESETALTSTLFAKIDRHKSGEDADEKMPDKLAKQASHAGTTKSDELKSINLSEVHDDKAVDVPIFATRDTSKDHPSEHVAGGPTQGIEIDVRVLKVETSFASAAPSTFGAQFCKAIIDNLDRPANAQGVVVGNPVLYPRRDVVKSIQIQLHPDDLGSIKVAMHLRGDELSLKIEVTNRKAETLLIDDHQIIQELMNKAGYDVKETSISISLNFPDQSAVQRQVAATDPPLESYLGQGNKQHAGTSQESSNHAQKTRGHYAAEFEGDQETENLASGSVRAGRKDGVFI
jgi:Flagellar hook-length control protein FliK